MKKIYVSDVTLCAVEKENFSLSFREKLAIAENLDSAGVDAVELPILKNNKESEIIYRTIAESLQNAMVKIPVGSDLTNIDFVTKCISKAKNPCLQVIMPLSTALMEYIYHVKAPVMLEKITELVKNAVSVCETVEFVGLDAFRADREFLLSCVKVATDNGAKAITICDDEGIALPQDYFDIVKDIKTVSNAKIYVQPSNKLSFAGACAVEALKAGADGVKTSVYGEYLSASLFSDIVRAKKYLLDVDCSIDTTNIHSIVDVINGITAEKGDSQQVINKGAFDSKTTIKQIAEVVKQLGYELSDSDIGNVYEEFKRLISKKESIDTKELEAVIASTAMQVPSTYHLVNYVVNSGNIIPATANVTLEKDGEKITGVSTGDGPIDAAFHAIEQVVGHHYELDDFQVHAVTKGRGAVGSSIIRLRANGKLYPGNGVSTDIVGACIRAYINALNKIVYEEN